MTAREAQPPSRTDRGPTGPEVRWLDDDHVVVDGVELVCGGFERGGSATRLPIWKPRHLVEAYLDELAHHPARRIVELGIAEGGSTALLTLAARPDRLVAVDRSTARVQALDDFLARHDPDETVRLHHGVDQADRPALEAIVDRELTEGIDLVIDDASHLLGPTRTSFDVLFPRLRPGGRFVIEDWNWEHAGAERVAADLDRIGSRSRSPAQTPIGSRLTPDAVRALSGSASAEISLDGPYAALVTGEVLSLLAVQLLLARATGGAAVASVHIDGDWIVATRGTGELDPARFRLDGLYEDHFGLLGREERPAEVDR